MTKPCHLTPNEKPILSIIIVSFNTKDITKDCLKSIYSADWRDKFEIIIVDNNSSDDSVKMIKEEFPDVKLIVNPDNRLFSIANNQGAKIAQGKYLLLLNSDTIVYNDNIQKMVDFFETQPKDVICIGPKILNKDRSIQSCSKPGFGKWKQLATLYGLNKLLPLYRFVPDLYCYPDKTHLAGWVAGCSMMMRTDLYNQIGGLNEKLIFYGEEPEFGYRSSKLGYKTLYYADAEIIHLGGASTKTDQAKKYSFDKDIKEYDRLMSETVGYKEAIAITRRTRMALRIKWLFYKNKKYVASRIAHEGRVIDYFKNKLKSPNCINNN